MVISLLLLWSECLSPPKLICWYPDAQGDGIRRWDLWEVIMSWEWSPQVSQIYDLISCTLQKNLLIFNEWSNSIKQNILVCLDYYNKIPQTGQLINSYLFLTILKAGSSRSRYRHGQVSSFFQVVDFSLYSPMVKRVSCLSVVLYKSTNLIHEGSIHITQSRPKGTIS